ncbi:hypothetical protein HELRODRAFT_127337, partial [Helobdella robusta]|uniref:Carboxylesterase type B domain-containing protein n=1 Tax=Helobdella robusta TaxID=6412 RepID=T1EHE0_HELRO
RVVATKYGKMRGLLITSQHGMKMEPVEAYLGLEYASLLDGQLRFMPPNPPTVYWSDIKMAVRYKPVCPQPILDPGRMKMEGRGWNEWFLERYKKLVDSLKAQQEECLYLNVYTP